MADPSHKNFKQFVSFIDNDKIKNKLNDLKENIKKKYSFKKAVMVLMVVVIVSMLFSIYKINEVRTRGYIVYFGEEEIGVVREKQDAIDILKNIRTELSNTYDSEIVLEKGLSFEDTHAKDELIATDKEIRSNIRSQLTFLVGGYALVIDDEEIGYTKSKEELEELLETIKEPYIDETEENSKILDVNFVENVKIEKKEIPLNKIDDTEELLQYIQTGSEEIKTHVVEVGESLWTIAKMHDVSVDDLVAANSGKDPEKLQIGDEIKLTVPKSLLTVSITEEVEYTANTDFEVNVEYDDDMYKTQSNVKVKGEEGETKFLSKITKHDGVVVDEEILKEEVIKKPVDQLVVKGTKELPKTAATGAFLMPTRGRLSSRYGWRNGRMHRGLDIAASTGTPIKAADGGKVVFAGWKGSYGRLVEISHENGYVTKYAHCSSINVSAGDRVYKGQVIARVGNTGNSTGPHLHFEVLKNGSNVNPASYVY